VSVLALAAGPAHAAMRISTVTAAPSTTQAGGHADFSVHVAFDRSTQTGNAEHPNTIVLHLPAGLIGNPQSASQCSQADFAARTCPATAKVGTSSITATSTLLGLTIPITASGTIYVLVPNPGEIARLGVDLFPDGTAATLSPHAILSQSVVSVRNTTDNGLDSTLTNLPRTAATTLGTADVELNSLDLTLDANAANGPFETNPTACAVNTTSVDVVSYEDPATVASGRDSFATTGCDQLPYTPTVNVAISSPSAQNGRPQLTTTILQGPGQAATRRVSLMLPSSVLPDLHQINLHECSLALQAQNACPPTTIVGTATAITPLLPIPLTGDVYMYATDGLTPNLHMTLAPLGISVTGVSDLPGGQIVTTFDNLPDTPLSSFALTFAGGPESVFYNGDDMCRNRETATGSLLGQNGKTVSVSTMLEVAGCRPVVSALLSGKGRRARLRLHAFAAHSGPALRSVRFLLPGRVTIARWRAGQHTLTPNTATARRVSGHVVSIALGSAGAPAVTLIVRAGAVHALHHGSRRVTVQTTDTLGRTVSQRVAIH
jgi:hypothetical protein